MLNKAPRRRSRRGPRTSQHLFQLHQNPADRRQRASHGKQQGDHAPETQSVKKHMAEETHLHRVVARASHSHTNYQLLMTPEGTKTPMSSAHTRPLSGYLIKVPRTKDTTFPEKARPSFANRIRASITCLATHQLCQHNEVRHLVHLLCGINDVVTCLRTLLSISSRTLNTKINDNLDNTNAFVPNLEIMREN